MVPSLVFYDELLLRYEYLYVRPILLSCIMDCDGNHEISYHQNAFIFEDEIFLHLSGPIYKYLHT